MYFYDLTIFIHVKKLKPRLIARLIAFVRYKLFCILHTLVDGSTSKTLLLRNDHHIALTSNLKKKGRNHKYDCMCLIDILLIFRYFIVHLFSYFVCIATPPLTDKKGYSL